jgi:UDP-N-acetylglucosamine 1-carboxyvinyltransferase
VDQFDIAGGRRLRGRVVVSGSKNAALPCLFATLLTDETCTLDQVPDLADIDTALRLLVTLGKKVDRVGTKVVVAKARSLTGRAPYDLVRRMRASVLVMGPLLARRRRATVSLPGGGAIGARPVNYHLEGFQRLRVQTTIHDGYVDARTKALKGSLIPLPFPSVGATENLMMGAVLARGTTIIQNAAREPEVVDLGRMLQKHLANVVQALRSTGLAITDEGRAVRVEYVRRLKPVSVETDVFPGFPTDMQAQWIALMSVTGGRSRVTETVFENRFLHVQELLRFGADIQLSGRNAIVRGVPELSGCTCMVSDLRAGAALVLAGLAARGKTTVLRVYHLDRGYEEMEKKLQALGARITRSNPTGSNRR